MIINIFTIVLGETLEAGFLFSLLLYACYRFSISKLYVLFGVLSGAFLATLYGNNLVAISEWFDYTGQEWINAVICSLLAMLLLVVSRGLTQAINTQGVPIFLLSMLAVIHEGAELYLFFQSVPNEAAFKIVFSALIALMIGSSFGVINYFCLQYLQHIGHKIAFFLSMLLASGLFMQASQLLIQADVLPQYQPLWNSEFLLSEQANLGELLRAMLRYESTPTGIEVAAYLTCTVMFLSVLLIPRRRL